MSDLLRVIGLGVVFCLLCIFIFIIWVANQDYHPPSRDELDEDDHSW